MLLRGYTEAVTAMACSDMLREALPMLWACLAHPDVDVALASSDAVGAFLQSLKRQLQAAKGGRKCGAGEKGTAAADRRFRAMEHLPQLLATLYQRMK